MSSSDMQNTSPHYHVFMSYCRADSETMRQIRSTLLSQGISVWTDEGIRPGTQDWQDTIEDAIEASDCFVVIFSPDAKNSRWVRAEMAYAEAQEKPRFYLLARGDVTSAVPFGYTNVQWIDICAKESVAAGVQRLIDSICERLQIEVMSSAPKIAQAAPPQPSPTPPEARREGVSLDRQVKSDAIASIVKQPQGQQSYAAQLVKEPSATDILSLLKWVLFAPARLEDYRRAIGDESVRKVGGWLASTMIWLPLMMPILGAILTTLPVSDEVPEIVRILVPGGVLICWWLLGALGPEARLRLTIPITVFTCIVSVPILNFMGYLGDTAEDRSWLLVLVSIAAAEVSTCVITARLTGPMATGISAMLAIIALQWAQFGYRIDTYEDTYDSSVITFYLILGLPFLLALIVGLNAKRIQRAIQNRTDSQSVNRIWIVLLVGSYAVLVGASFLGFYILP